MLNPGDRSRVVRRLVNFKKLTFRLAGNGVEDWLGVLKETGNILWCDKDFEKEGDAVGGGRHGVLTRGPR